MKWIVWKGGKMPVSADTPVDLKFRDGEIIEADRGYEAGTWNWEHSGNNGDIVAYRINKLLT